MHYLGCHPGGVYLDGTVGMGGHASAVLESTAPDGILVGIDRDEESLGEARRHLAPFKNRVTLVHDNFAHAADVLEELGIRTVDGILLDLGISSYQLEQSGRGFSFKTDEPLDMRMDRESPLTAQEIVNRFPAVDLEKIIWEYGEERWARRIVRVIIREREREPILTAARLAAIISSAIPRRFHSSHIHPATRTFQALRIAVNRELENLATVLASTVAVLKPGGRFCVISFHSLEDRIVKTSFRDMEKPGPLGEGPMVRRLTRKPVTPSPEECAANPRARSAKLRAAERVAG